MKADDSQFETLNDFPVVITLPVQWGDQDAFGHVNNTVYLRWCESARIEYCRRVGLWQLFETDRVGPILASINCEYRRPVQFPDVVRIGAKITRIGRSSMTMRHLVQSEAHAAAVADGQTTLVVFDYNTQASRAVPVEIRRAIEKLEKTAFD